MRRLLSLTFIAALFFTLAGSLSACGKRATPEHPPGSSYPHKYPAED
jgi:hypothetical protein